MDNLLSDIAFKFNLRRYTKAAALKEVSEAKAAKKDWEVCTSTQCT
jgi:hypothetical protein